MTINFETLKLKILWRLIYKHRQIFSRLQSIWIRWAQLICHTSRCRGLDSAGCQLVLFCLYLYYESKPAELLRHLQLNFCPSATTSWFVEKFLNFCFTSMRFWLDFECKQLMPFVIFQLITINHHKQIAFNCQHDLICCRLMADWWQTDGMADWFCLIYLCLDALKSLWRWKLILQRNHFKDHRIQSQ